MKVLHLSRYDSGGNGYFTAQAVNAYTEHRAMAVRDEQTYLAYPYNILHPSEETLKTLITGADILHIRDGWEWLPNEIYQKPVVITFSGNMYRRRFKELHQKCEEMGWMVTVSTIDLVLLNSAPWMPNPREDMSHDLFRRDKFCVCHTPTFRDRKGTATIEQALSDMDDVELVIVEGKSYKESVAMRSQCHITIDQFRHGYGNSAIEAWAMAHPVIAYAKDSPEVVNLIREKFEHLPWCNSPEHVRYIKRWVTRLKDDSSNYRGWRDAGRRWFFKHHHAPQVAARAVKLYEMVLNGAQDILDLEK